MISNFSNYLRTLNHAAGGGIKQYTVHIIIYTTHCNVHYNNKFYIIYTTTKHTVYAMYVHTIQYTQYSTYNTVHTTHHTQMVFIESLYQIKAGKSSIKRRFKSSISVCGLTELTSRLKIVTKKTKTTKKDDSVQSAKFQVSSFEFQVAPKCSTMLFCTYSSGNS